MRGDCGCCYRQSRRCQRTTCATRIGELFVDGDVHIHNPTSGNNTSKTPFAVTKRAAQDKHKKYEASSKKDGFEFLSLGAEDTGAMDPEFKECARRLSRMWSKNPAFGWRTWCRSFVSGVAHHP